MPCPIRGGNIWGATAGILKNLYERLLLAMIRVVIENILLFLTPMAMYVAYMLLTRRAASAGTVVSDAPLIWLFVAGALLVVATLVFYGSTSGAVPARSTSPAHGQGRAHRARPDQVALNERRRRIARARLSARRRLAHATRRRRPSLPPWRRTAMKRARWAVRFATRLLGRRVGDVDLATPARPEAVMAAAQAAGLKAIATGLTHGTVTVIAEGHRLRDRHLARGRGD